MLGRVLFRLVLTGCLLLVVAGPLRDALGGDAQRRPMGPISPVPAQGIPPQLADVLGEVGEMHRQSLAGRLVGRGGGPRDAWPAAAQSGPQPFADRGSRRHIARLRRDVHRALRAASTLDNRVAAAAWQGVYVSGRRAVALVDLRRAIRTRQGLPFRRLPVTRTRLELRRQARRWQIVNGAQVKAG